jgi:predicted nucleotide-binding protein
MPVQLTVTTLSARKNIFLDFMCPENHTIYGADRNLTAVTLVLLLCESLNVAVLLSGDYCFLPPGFALQSEIIRETLLSKSDFLTKGAIRIPVREASLVDFFEKKIVEYEAFKHQYSGFFDQQGHRFVERFAASIIKRQASIGRHIATRWEAGPDETHVWRPIVDELTAREIEALRSVPRILKESGESITWLGMQRHLPRGIERAGFEVNQALQHEYALIYLKEYNATIITGAPPKTTDFLLIAPDLSYDYLTFSRVLTALGLWDAIRTMDAESILQLKFSRGFLDFISLFDYVCKQPVARLGVIHHFARLFDDLRRIKPRDMKEFSHINRLILARRSSNAVEIISEFLFELTALENPPSSYLSVPVLNYYASQNLGKRAQMKNVFVVHGSDRAIRDQILLFLREKGLVPIVMEREVMSGRTLVEKFEELAQQCEYSIVIATPDDDLVHSRDGHRVKRLRQNVILEIGYFWGKNERHGKFSILLKSDPELELPSDISGIGYIPITDDLGETKLRLEEELKHSGVLPAL